MDCPKCGQENPDDARFCGECGALQRKERREAGPYRPSESVTGPRDIPPRGLGQLIDETFKVYGKAILPFLAIALIPQIPAMLNLAVSGSAEDAALRDTILALASLLIGVIAGTASVFCVGRVLTGRNVDVIDCYARALNVLLPALAASIIIGLALVGSAILMLVIIGVPLFFYVLVIWFFAIQAVVLERKSTLAALQRSRELVQGNWWRVFGIGVAFTLLAIALLIPATIVSILVGLVNSVLSEVVVGVAVALVTPVFYIGSTLVYIDLRVRKEDYDLQGLVDDLAGRPEEARR